MIQSIRASLRRLCENDFAFMRQLESDPLVMKFTPSRVPQSEEQTRVRLDAQLAMQEGLEPFGIWVAESKADGAFLGWFMLMPRDAGVVELGFMLVRSQWSLGYATEIGRTLLDWAHSGGKATKVIAQTDLDNLTSIRTLEKLGFLYLGRKTTVQSNGRPDLVLNEYMYPLE